MNNRLKLVRKQGKDKTQAAFAAALCVSRNYITQLEMGAKTPSDRFVRDVCRIYNVNEEWLRNGTGDMYTARSRNENIAAFLNEVMAEESDSSRRRWLEVLANTDVEFWEELDRLAVEYVEKRERVDISILSLYVFDKKPNLF